jgi:hypothetical protein
MLVALGVHENDAVLRPAADERYAARHRKDSRK